MSVQMNVKICLSEYFYVLGSQEIRYKYIVMLSYSDFKISDTICL